MNTNTANHQVFGIEPSITNNPIKDGDDHPHPLTSAHTIDSDSWKQVGLLLVTSFNCGYILSFSNLMMVPLGWSWGITCLLIVGFFTAYANWLLAGFHIIDGNRFIRYRDLMGFVFGRKMYYLTWVLQFFTLLLGNMGFLLLGARALKEINSEFLGSGEAPLRIQYFVIITGGLYLIFSVLVPNLSSMRRWLVISLVLAFTYVATLLVILVKDGKSNRNRDYTIKGTKVDKMFNGFGAIAAILVCNTSGLLPEIQSTLRKPAVKNMRKALYLQYTIGLAVYYGVSIVGYWAYGSIVPEYLPKELSGPRWAKVVINSGQFLQSVIAQHMYISPVHEALDTKFLKLDQNMNSMNNIKRRIILRVILFGANIFITATFPFMGDFVNLLGSFALFPLTFVFPSMIYIKMKGKTARIEQKMWHWGNIVIFSLLTVMTSTSAVRLILNNIKIYRFFADT